MSKQIITTNDASRPLGAYSQGVRAGDFVFVTGCGPIDSATAEVRGETIEEQTEATLDNIEAILTAAGATFADVVKATVHLIDEKDFGGFNGVYASRVPEPRPVRTTVCSGLGVVPSMRIEIDVIAYLGD